MLISNEWIYNTLKEISKELNQKCPYWINDQILGCLKEIDKSPEEGPTNFALDYIQQCHTPVVELYEDYDSKWVCKCSCVVCEDSLGLSCKEQFPDIAERFLEKFLELKKEVEESEG